MKGETSHEPGLRASRSVLFQRLDVAVKTAEDRLAFQIDIAEALRAAEGELKAKKDGTEALKFHIRRLRLYADGLVWRTLHPHAIRQLAKNAGSPQNLLSQGDAFDNVLAHARRYLEETGLPLLIADITTVIKIGDIILVADVERPTIIECKMKLAGPRHLMQGRFGRQVSRAIGTMQYLDEGTAKVFGDEHPRVVVETEHKPARNWKALERIISKASDEGEAFRELQPGDYLWALRPERRESIMAQVAEKGKSIGFAQFGTAQGLMNFEDGLYAPPSAWPISLQARFALLEGTIDLCHLVSYDTLTGDFGDGRSIEIREGDYPIVVTIRGREYPLSRRFVYDVVYGFETVDSCVKGLLTFAEDLASSLPPVPPDVPETKPSICYVGTIEEIPSILERGDLPDTDLVALPRQVLTALGELREVDKDREGGLAVMRVDALRTLVSRSARTDTTP